MQRIVFVHRSVGHGDDAWAGQAVLADAYELLVLNRPGFPPGPPVDSIDFDVHGAWVADQLRPGDHLCGVSYGGVVSMYAAGTFPELASLTVIEPPAFGIVTDRPDVTDVIARAGPCGPVGRRTPAASCTGSSSPSPGARSSRFPIRCLRTSSRARALMVERFPWEATPPFAQIAAACYPVLAVSGGWNPEFDAVLDVIAQELDAERATAIGAGHAAQRSPDFNGV